MVKIVHKWVEIEQKTMVFQPRTLEIPLFLILLMYPFVLNLSHIYYMKIIVTAHPK